MSSNSAIIKDPKCHLECGNLCSPKTRLFAVAPFVILCLPDWNASTFNKFKRKLLMNVVQQIAF